MTPNELKQFVLIVNKSKYAEIEGESIEEALNEHDGLFSRYFPGNHKGKLELFQAFCRKKRFNKLPRKSSKSTEMAAVVQDLVQMVQDGGHLHDGNHFALLFLLMTTIHRGFIKKTLMVVLLLLASTVFVVLLFMQVEVIRN